MATISSAALLVQKKCEIGKTCPGHTTNILTFYYSIMHSNINRLQGTEISPWTADSPALAAGLKQKQ